MNLLKDKHIPVLISYLDDIYPIPTDQLSKYMTVKLKKYTYITVESDVKEQVQVWNYIPCKQLIAKGFRKEDIMRFSDDTVGA